MITKAQKEKYYTYLKSKEWKELKIDLLQLRGCNCERCGVKKAANILHIHHKTYARLYNELMADLEILCSKCHMDEHGITNKGKKKRSKTLPKKVRHKKTAVQIYENSLRRIKNRKANGKYPNEKVYQRVLQQASTKGNYIPLCTR